MKTPEEIKKGLACCRNVWVDDHWKNCDGACPYQEEQSYCKNVLHHDALAYIKQLEAKDPQWISVKEKLPETDNYCIVFEPGYGYEVCMYYGDGEWLTPDLSNVTRFVSRWMPLPPSPEEVK